MKLFVVYGGWDYEGEDGESVRVFSSVEKAEVYRQKLVKEDHYSYVCVDERELDVE